MYTQKKHHTQTMIKLTKGFSRTSFCIDNSALLVNAGHVQQDIKTLFNTMSYDHMDR